MVTHFWAFLFVRVELRTILRGDSKCPSSELHLCTSRKQAPFRLLHDNHIDVVSTPSAQDLHLEAAGTEVCDQQQTRVSSGPQNPSLHRSTYKNSHMYTQRSAPAEKLKSPVRTHLPLYSVRVVPPRPSSAEVGLVSTLAVYTALCISSLLSENSTVVFCCNSPPSVANFLVSRSRAFTAALACPPVVSVL